jgi:hypothetical protein
MVHDEQLVRLLGGELSGEERNSLESSLQSDEVLRERYERLQLTRDAIRLHGIREQVSAVREQMNGGKAVPAAVVVPMRRWVRAAMAVAASVLVIFLCAKGLQVYRLSPENVYAENMVRYNPGLTRSGSAAQSPLEQAYAAGDHTETLRLAAGRALTPKQQLLASLSSLEVGQNARAIELLSPLQADPTYRQDAQFYLGMAQLRSGHYDAALALLSPIASDPSHLYHQQVTQSLLSDIRWLKRKS